MELIVQKAVELGAARVVPVAMSRCVVQLSAKDGAKKQERWQKIAREACKQSGRCQMMAVDAPIAFPALLAALKTHEAAIVPWEDARGYSLTAFHRERGRNRPDERLRLPKRDARSAHFTHRNRRTLRLKRLVLPIR